MFRSSSVTPSTGQSPRRKDPKGAIKPAFALLLALLAGGCAEQGDFFKGLSWLQSSRPPISDDKTYMTLPSDPVQLGAGPMEGALRNAMDLAKTKRFAEARMTLADIAKRLPPESDLWRAVKCSELTMALRGNEIAVFLTAAQAVERNLKDSLRPPAECVAQLAIARAMKGQPLPVNVPDGLSAELQSTAPERTGAAGRSELTQAANR